jgi:uncharacterized protein (TIGR03435 family)
VKRIHIALAVTAGALEALATLAMPLPISAQVAVPSPIEAASLKPAGEFDGFVGCRRSNPGLFECRRATLKAMLIVAYGIKPYQIKGPTAISTERYSLIVRIQKGASESQFSAALQSLLTERFKIVLHRETESLPAYELTVGKGGLKAKEVDPAEIAAADGAARSIRLMLGADGSRSTRGNMTIAQITSMLSNALERPVIDGTGLKGTYEVDLTYGVSELDPSQAQMRQALAADPRVNSPLPPVDADSRLPGLPQAVKENLGLELKAKQLPIEVLVIDQAEKVPLEN